MPSGPLVCRSSAVDPATLMRLPCTNPGFAAAKKETPAASFNTGYWPDFSTGQPLRFACMTATLPM